MAEPSADQATAGRRREGGRLGALGHGLAVLDMFDLDRQVITPIEIARQLDIHKSTASRIGANLALSGYLVPGPNGAGFRLSGKLSRLGAIAAFHSDLTTISTEFVQALVADVGETCHVGVLEGSEAVTTVLVNGWYSMRMQSFVGKRNEAHMTAMGKVLLAGLSDATVDMLFPNRVLNRQTEHTIGTLAELKEQLGLVREHGFALDDEELEPGLRCVAVPITDHSGAVVAALTIAGAASRLTMAKVDAYVGKAQQMAGRISAALGAPDGSANDAEAS